MLGDIAFWIIVIVAAAGIIVGGLVYVLSLFDFSH